MLINPGTIPPDFPVRIAIAVGERWTMPGWNFGPLLSSGPLSDTRIFYIPVFVSKATTFIRIGVYVQVLQVGGLIRLGIYANNNGVPGVRLLNAGTISTTTTGAKEIVINTPLARGAYWLAARAEGPGTAELLTIDPAQGWSSPFGDLSSGLGVGGRPLVGVTGAWADPATAPTLLLPVNYMAIFLRDV